MKIPGYSKDEVSEAKFLQKILNKVVKDVSNSEAEGFVSSAKDYMNRIKKASGEAKERIVQFMDKIIDVNSDYMFFINTHSSDKADAEEILKSVKDSFKKNFKTNSLKGVMMKGRYGDENNPPSYGILIPVQFSIAFTPKNA